MRVWGSAVKMPIHWVCKLQKGTRSKFKAPLSGVLCETYLASNLVVVQVHQGPGVLLDLPRVDEHLGEAQAVADVGRAAAPLPSLVDAVEALLLLVAAAVAQVTLRAGGRDGVGHARRDDGVREGGLFAAWRKEGVAEERREVINKERVVRSKVGFFSAQGEEKNLYFEMKLKKKS